MHRLTIDKVSRVTISGDSPFGINAVVQLTEQPRQKDPLDTADRLRAILASWLVWPAFPEITQLIEVLSSPDTPVLAHHIVPVGTWQYMHSFCLADDDGVQSVIIEHRTHSERITCSLETAPEGAPSLRFFLEGPQRSYNHHFCALIDLIPTDH